MRPRDRPALCASVFAALVGVSACASRAPTNPPFPSPPVLRSPAARTPAVGTATASALIATAVALVGTPYHAGGQAPHTGFDCSGFVLWVFGQHGLGVPRTVSALFDTGDPLAPGTAPAPADLVFFDTDGAGASHVGIALGDGRFVHAPSSRGVVRVEVIGSPYWAGRYLGARRLLRHDQSRAPGPPAATPR